MNISTILVPMIVIGVMGSLIVGTRKSIAILVAVLGALLEAAATSFSQMVGGATMVAIAGVVLSGKDKIIFTGYFGSVFMMTIGASILAIFARTEALWDLRIRLGAVADPVTSVAVLMLWFALAIRMVALPIMGARVGATGLISTIGAGWWSALILATRLVDTIPQQLISSIQQPAMGALVIVLSAVALASMRADCTVKWDGYAVAFTGAVIHSMIWHGIAHDSSRGLMLGLRTVLIATSIVMVSQSRIEGLAYVRRILRLVLAGFPLTVPFLYRRSILGSVTIPLHVTMVCGWLLLLISVFRRRAETVDSGPGVFRLIASLIGVVVGLGASFVNSDWIIT